MIHAAGPARFDREIGIAFAKHGQERAERRIASSRVFRVRNVLFEVNVFPRHAYIAACRGRSPHPEKLQNGVTP